jgi:DNA polymerase-3 subunit chi
VQADFYQLAGSPPEPVIASLCDKVLATGGRMLVVAEDEGFLAKLDRILWDQGASSFLPHGLAGGADDTRQPVLLSTSPGAPNHARNLLIADGLWREAALGYDRTFYLFGESALQGARAAWKQLGGRDRVERRYWAQESGRWTKKA